MALKRLDEEFELKPGTQLLPYMKRLLPSLEGRFQDLESTQEALGALTAEIRAAALLRMNEILIPATEDIIAVTKLGFLLAPVAGSVTLGLGGISLQIAEGPQQETFTPSPYLIIEHSLNDYVLARTISYDQEMGLLAVEITATHGNMGPWPDWMVSSTPGMADSTKLYHDAIAPMHTEVVADTAEVRVKHQEILDAAESLEEAGLDLFNYVRRDGTVPFTAVQHGINPTTGSNDVSLATTAWSRARMIEYAGDALMKAGGTMTGALSLAGMPVAPAHAASKAYVDSIIGQGGVIQNSVTLRTINPSLKLQSTSTAQTRSIESMSSAGSQRWVMAMADPSAEAGGNAGSNWVLSRYSDAGALIDSPLSVSRATGTLSTKAISAVGDVTVVGDINAYRSATPTTGIVYLNQSRSAYHHFDGANHILAGGGLNAGAISSGAISCGALNTNGNSITSGSHTMGASTVNGQFTINGGLRLNGAGSNMIELWDNDWGSMFIHHNNENCGFLGPGGNWLWYINTNGHVYSPAYGWLHDYVNQTASNNAWYAANYRYDQTIQQFRMAYAGEWSLDDILYNIAGTNIWEPHGNSSVTGVGVSQYYFSYIWAIRVRQNQAYRPDWGGWYAVGVA